MNTEELIQQTKREMRTEFNEQLTNNVKDTQQLLDGMASNFQKALDQTVAHAKKNLEDERAKISSSALFNNLFDTNAQEFLAALDNPSTPAPVLQRKLYLSTDLVVAGLNHGKTTKFYHIQKAEAIGAAVTAVATGVLLRKVAEVVGRKIQERRAAKAEAQAYGL